MAFPITNFPETLKICTLDDKVMEVTGKLINESEVLKQAFEMHDNSEVGEMMVPVVSDGLQNALKLFEFFDLQKPHVEPKTHIERRSFQEENIAALGFLEKLPHDEMYAICTAADSLECKRLIDCCLVFFLNMSDDKSPNSIREMFGLKNDYTEEEEAEILKKHFHEKKPLR